MSEIVHTFSRTVDTSIVIAGTSKYSGKPVFYTVPRSPELTALVAGAVANKLQGREKTGSGIYDSN